MFVSSHLLGEVQQMCDRVAIVARGRLLVAGTVDEVAARGGRAVLVRVERPDRAIAVLGQAGLAATADGEMIKVADVDDPAPRHRAAGPRGALRRRAAARGGRPRDGVPRPHGTGSRPRGRTVTALLAVEARRAWARRIWKGLALFALGGIVLAGVLVYLNASPDSALPDTTGFQARHLVYDGSDESGILTGSAIPFALLAFVVGASLIGAEWRAGTMGVVLAWEPRRSRVMLAKAAVATAAGAAFTLALQLILLLALLPSASRATAGVDGEFWRQLVAVLLRSSLAAGLLALIGFGIASLGRNTERGVRRDPRVRRGGRGGARRILLGLGPLVPPAQPRRADRRLGGERGVRPRRERRRGRR